MRKVNFVVVLVILSVIFLIGCEQKDRKLNIVTTMILQYELTQAIVVDNVKLSMLKQGDSFPSTSDIGEIENADVFIYIGDESDAWVDNILSSIDVSNKKIIKLTDYIELITKNIEYDDEHSDYDHDHYEGGNVLISLESAIKFLNIITEYLCELDINRASIYRQNAETNIKHLEELNREFEDLPLLLSGYDSDEVAGISDKIFFNQCQDIYLNSDYYKDTEIRLEGMYDEYTDEDGLNRLVYRKTVGESGADVGFIFRFSDGYDGEMPKPNNWIKVSGTVEPVEFFNGRESIILNVTELAVIPKRS